MQQTCGATSVCSPPAAYKLIWSDTGVMSVLRKERRGGGSAGKVSMSSASADNPPRPRRNPTPLIHNYSTPSISIPHTKSKKTIYLQYKFFVRWIRPLIAVAFDGFPVSDELTMWSKEKWAWHKSTQQTRIPCQHKRTWRSESKVKEFKFIEVNKWILKLLRSRKLSKLGRAKENTTPWLPVSEIALISD